MMFVQGFSVYYVRELVEEHHHEIEEDPVAAFEEDGVCTTDFGLQFILVGVFTAVVWDDIIETIYMMAYVAKVPGIPYCVKVWLQLTIYIPKMLIVEALWFYGAGFLTLSKGMTEMILNAVALNFIITIDNYLYTGIVSKHMQNGMVHLNTRPLNYKIQTKAMHWITNSIHLLALPAIFFATLCATVNLPYSCPGTSGNLTAHWDSTGQSMIAIFGVNY